MLGVLGGASGRAADLGALGGITLAAPAAAPNSSPYPGVNGDLIEARAFDMWAGGESGCHYYFLTVGGMTAPLP